MQTITCTAVVERDVLDFFTSWAGPNREGRPERLRRRVRVKVRGLTVDRESGTRVDVTSSWGGENLDRANGDDYTLDGTVDNTGQREVVREARDVEGGRRFGMRLDLR